MVRFFVSTEAENGMVFNWRIQFYTPGDNIGIAKGTFPLTQEMIDAQIKYTQKANQYYLSQGIDYYYLLYPAKTDIYSEFLPNDIYYTSTPIDIVMNSFSAYPDIHVTTPKYNMYDAKATGRLLYLPKDVHTSDYGAYITYTNLCATMSTAERRLQPIDVQFVDGQYPIGANTIAGVTDLFGKSEIGPVAMYDSQVTRVTDGPLFSALTEILSKPEYANYSSSAYAIFENPAVEDGTLLIYGTSMFLYDNIGEAYQLTRYLAEHFRTVVYIGKYTPIIPEIDALVKPTVVLRETPERYLNQFVADLIP